MDGIRIDTVMHVPKPFWKEFSQASGVFQMGEVFRGDIKYLAEYQKVLDSLLNYPMYYALRDVFIKQFPPTHLKCK